MMDLRARMKEKGNGILKKGTDFDDSKTLIGNYVSEEELWACTTCNACAKECPVNIDHPSLIVDMRRYLVMEKSSAPSGINSIFANIENNGSPWQISWEDRMRWAENL
jgi:Fe-S oxidoreductase